MSVKECLSRLLLRVESMAFKIITYYSTTVNVDEAGFRTEEPRLYL